MGWGGEDARVSVRMCEMGRSESVCEGVWDGMGWGGCESVCMRVCGMGWGCKSECEGV